MNTIVHAYYTEDPLGLADWLNCKFSYPVIAQNSRSSSHEACLFAGETTRVLLSNDRGYTDTITAIANSERDYLELVKDLELIPDATHEEYALVKGTRLRVTRRYLQPA